jgi:hypothetical protein
LGALIKGLDGALRAPNESEIVFYERIDILVSTRMPDSETHGQSQVPRKGDAVDESQKQAAGEARDSEGSEFKKFVEIAPLLNSADYDTAIRARTESDLFRRRSAECSGQKDISTRQCLMM